MMRIAVLTVTRAATRRFTTSCLTHNGPSYRRAQGDAIAVHLGVPEACYINSHVRQACEQLHDMRRVIVGA